MTIENYSTNSFSIERDPFSDTPKKMYSPLQVCLGTIGGPLALIFFLMENFKTLGRLESRRTTMYAGIIFLIAYISLYPILSGSFIPRLFTFLYIIAARYITETYQLKKQDIIDSEEFEFHSNWRVLIMSGICLIITIPFVAGPLELLYPE